MKKQMNSCTYLQNLVGEEQSCLTRIAALRAEQTPDAPFLVWQDQSYSYADSWQLTRQLGGLLDELELAGNGKRIASYLPNCPETVWTWFAAYLTGSVYVPLNRAHKGELLIDMMRRARAQVLVTEASALEQLPDPQTIGFKKVIIVGPELPEGCIAFSEIENAVPVDPVFSEPSELATLMYTSGTTGRSKCVRLPHNIYARNAARHAEAMAYTSADIFHMWFPQFHIWGSLTTAGIMCAGGSIALFPSFSASAFWEQIEHTGATWFGGLANVLHILLSKDPGDTDNNNTLRAGHAAIVPADIKRIFEKRFDVRLYDEYGMTEAEPITLPAPDRDTPLESVGVVNPDFEVILVDTMGMPVADGKRGHLLARPKISNVMMQGYEGDDAATVSVFRDLWFHTGDLAHRDTMGFIFIHGRVKHMIRHRGENISAMELEGLIAEHPEVNQVACVGVPSPIGEEDVKAVVVLVDSSVLQGSELHLWCRDRMAKFMVPRYIEIIDALPHNQVGKVEKEALKTITDNIWDAERDLEPEK